MKCQQGFTTEIGYLVGNVLGYTMVNVPYRSLEGEVSNRLFNSNIVSLVLKTNEQRGRVEAERLIFLFCSLECLNCWRVGGGGVRQIVLFWFYHFFFFIFLPFILLHACWMVVFGSAKWWLLPWFVAIGIVGEPAPLPPTPESWLLESTRSQRLTHLLGEVGRHVWLIVGQVPMKAGWWDAPLALWDLAVINLHSLE